MVFGSEGICSMNLSTEIEWCSRCIDIGITDSSRLILSQKPYVKFDVERKWRPNRVCVLFIAESPPKNGKQRYFYNPTRDNKSGLRKEVLRYLNLQSLEEFKDKGYFLVDAVKCRLDKSKGLKSPLRLPKIAKTCTNRFLLKEIENMKPDTIFVLGNTAKKALESFPKFQELKKHKVTEDFDQMLNSYRVILCVFLGRRTRKHVGRIKRAFGKV